MSVSVKNLSTGFTINKDVNSIVTGVNSRQDIIPSGSISGVISSYSNETLTSAYVNSSTNPRIVSFCWLTNTTYAVITANDNSTRSYYVRFYDTAGTNLYGYNFFSNTSGSIEHYNLIRLDDTSVFIQDFTYGKIAYCNYSTQKYIDFSLGGGTLSGASYYHKALPVGTSQFLLVGRSYYYDRVYAELITISSTAITRDSRIYDTYSSTQNVNAAEDGYDTYIYNISDNVYGFAFTARSLTNSESICNFLGTLSISNNTLSFINCTYLDSSSSRSVLFNLGNDVYSIHSTGECYKYSLNSSNTYVSSFYSNASSSTIDALSFESRYMGCININDKQVALYRFNQWNTAYNDYKQFDSTFYVLDFRIKPLVLLTTNYTDSYYVSLYYNSTYRYNINAVGSKLLGCFNDNDVLFALPRTSSSTNALFRYITPYSFSFKMVVDYVHNIDSDYVPCLTNDEISTSVSGDIYICDR